MSSRIFRGLFRGHDFFEDIFEDIFEDFLEDLLFRINMISNSDKMIQEKKFLKKHSNVREHFCNKKTLCKLFKKALTKHKNFHFFCKRHESSMEKLEKEQETKRESINKIQQQMQQILLKAAATQK
ncbi:unnamed protein product, partial [Meganyctiphanes norvegica]